MSVQDKGLAACPTGIISRLKLAQDQAVDFLNVHQDADQSPGTPVLAMVLRSLGLARDLLYEGVEPNDASRSHARHRVLNVGYIAVYLTEYCAKRGIDLGAAISAAEADREVRAGG